VTRPPFSIAVLSRAQREIDAADLWWSQNRENRDAVRDQFRGFCELPDIEYHVYYRVRPRAQRIEVLSFWYAGRGTRPQV